MTNTCGFCEKTDGMCYTSNPPKRKCTITGKFHEYDHICDVPQTNADRMNAMSIEEKAKFLTAVSADGCPPKMDWDCAKDKAGWDACDACWCKWLQQPAED